MESKSRPQSAKRKAQSAKREACTEHIRGFGAELDELHDRAAHGMEAPAKHCCISKQ
jgi:hypothetical protein